MAQDKTSADKCIYCNKTAAFLYVDRNEGFNSRFDRACGPCLSKNSWYLVTSEFEKGYSCGCWFFRPEYRRPLNEPRVEKDYEILRQEVVRLNSTNKVKLVLPEKSGHFVSEELQKSIFEFAAANNLEWTS